MGAAAAPAVNCPANYTAATHIVINVEWAGSLALTGGNGEVHVWTKSQFAAAGDGVHVTSRSCGSLLPVIKLSILGGGYSVLPEIPDATWDVAAMPTFTGLATRTLGGGLQVSPGVALVGLSMADPLAPWPSANGVVGLDHDADGNLGITALPRQGGGFTAPPTSISQSTRVDKLFLAIRTVMTLRSESAGCPESDQGTADVTMFDSHVIGCHVAGGSDCSVAERDFVDANRTVYKILDAHYTTKRVSDTATCADVRAGLPLQ
jgi:hypothetical protein